jgi:hypothetical protein
MADLAMNRKITAITKKKEALGRMNLLSRRHKMRANI